MIKKNIVLLIVTLILAACSQSKTTFKQEVISLTPQPVSFILKESSFEFESDTKIVLHDDCQQSSHCW